MAKSNNLKFYVFLLFIIVLSLSTINYPRIIESEIESSSIKIFFASIFFAIFIHLQLYKVYNRMIGLKEKRVISTGLLYSSIMGAFLAVILSIILFTYSRSPNYDFHFSEELTIYGIYLLMIVHSLCILTLFIIDSISLSAKRVSKIKIFFASLVFYVLNFVISFFIFVILMLTVGGPVFG